MEHLQNHSNTMLERVREEEREKRYFPSLLKTNNNVNCGISSFSCSKHFKYSLDNLTTNKYSHRCNFQINLKHLQNMVEFGHFNNYMRMKGLSIDGKSKIKSHLEIECIFILSGMRLWVLKRNKYHQKKNYLTKEVTTDSENGRWTYIKFHSKMFHFWHWLLLLMIVGFTLISYMYDQISKKYLCNTWFLQVQIVQNMRI